MRSARTRQEITAEVLAGRLTLSEAARGFVAAGASNRPGVFRFIVNSFPGTSAEERALHWVVESVKWTVGPAPTSRERALIRTLKAELVEQRLFDRPYP